MLNKEKYREEIAKIALDGDFFAISTLGVPMICNYNACENCKFFIMQEASTQYGSCRNAMKDWLNDEFQETDWTKVPVDTKIFVKDSVGSQWIKRHFATYKDGAVYAFDNGCTSFTCIGKEDLSRWAIAKIAEPEQGEL